MRGADADAAGTASPIADRIAVAVLLLVPAILVFGPGLKYPFLDLDDAQGIVQHAAIRDLSWRGIRFLFLEDKLDLRYFPVTYLSLAIDYRLFGLDPFYFHLTNLILHLANTLMVGALVYALCRDELTAAITALVFSIHPLQIESVTWAISRKNVLFLFFFLASALVYLASVRRLPGKRGAATAGFVASALLYLLGCWTKTAAITLPAALVVIDYARDPDARRDPLGFLRRSLPTKLVYVPMLVLVFVVAKRYQSTNPFQTHYGFSAFEWILVLGYNLFFYVAKTIAPFRLGVFYALPQPGALPLRFAVFAGLALLLLLVTMWAWWRDRRVVFVGLAWYLVTIAPLALLLVVYSDFPLLVADRYYYQSAPGLLLLPALGFTRLWRHRIAPRPVLAGAGALAVAALCVAAAEHRTAFRSDLTLYEELCAHDPTDEFAYRLALEYGKADRKEDAFRALDLAERSPSQMFFMKYFTNRLRISALYRERGSFGKAADQLEAGIEITPNHFEPRDARTPLAYMVLADLRERAGDWGGAARARAKAALAKPDRERFFEISWMTASPFEAKRFLEERIATDPNDAMNWYYFGLLAQLMGDERTAMERLDRAKQLGYRP
jgi:tetratricopeptide (TPR) repeat protein